MGNGTAITAARPMIALNGQDDPSLSEGLLSLIVVENTNGLYRCEAVLGNWGAVNQSIGYLYFDRQTLDFGKGLSVKIGRDTVFDGKIMALEAHYRNRGPRELSVLAEDRLQDLRMTRRTRTFSNVTDADVINRIANDHGLSPQVNVTGPTHKVLAQVNQSDLAFLRERARAIDAEIWMENTTLRAESRAGRNGTPLQLAYGDNLREFSVIADLAGQRTSMIVSGWDVAGKTALNHEATDSVISNELGDGVSGSSILSSSFGPRKEAVVHTVPLTSSEAQAEAEAFFRMAARRFVVGRGVADTDSRLRVGAAVDLQGLGPLFNGAYYVSEIKHLFDGAKGIRTEFTAERPALGQP